MLTAKDVDITPPIDDVDEFRIKIWDGDSNDDAIVYGNQQKHGDDEADGAEISGDNIVIHKVSSEARAKRNNPNPSGK